MSLSSGNPPVGTAGGFGQDVTARRMQPRAAAGCFHLVRHPERSEGSPRKKRSLGPLALGTERYAPRLEGPVRLGPFFGSGFAAFAGPERPGLVFFDGFFGTSSAGAPSSPSGFFLRTVSIRPPDIRRARSERDSLRGPFSFASNRESTNSKMSASA